MKQKQEQRKSQIGNRPFRKRDASNSEKQNFKSKPDLKVTKSNLPTKHLNIPSKLLVAGNLQSRKGHVTLLSQG